jgi:hypothetical protein
MSICDPPNSQMGLDAVAALGCRNRPNFVNI